MGCGAAAVGAKRGRKTPPAVGDAAGRRMVLEPEPGACVSMQPNGVDLREGFGSGVALGTDPRTNMPPIAVSPFFIRNTETNPVVIGFLAFFIGNSVFCCFGCEGVRSPY